MPELTLEQRGDLLKQKITQLYQEIKAISKDAKAAKEDNNAFPVFRGKYKSLENMYTQFVQSWESLQEIHLLLGKEQKDFPFEEKLTTYVRNCVYECNNVYETIMNPIPQPPQLSASATHTAGSTSHDTTTMLDATITSNVRTRLPKINIPSLYGDVLKWPQFRDVFLSLVHDESALTSIEKFHHLIGSLKDEPLQIVSAFPLVADNYQAAWKALNSRFNNKRILGSLYFQKIRQFKPVSSPVNNLMFLRSFLKTIAENFSALKALKIDNEADFLKLHLALECLDQETRKLYEEKQQGQEFPTYESLITFIQQRCQILELSDSNAIPVRAKPNVSAVIRPKILTSFDNQNSKTEQKQRYNCPYCKQNHLLFKCFAFKALPPKERMEIVRKVHLCFNCLRDGHTVNNCPSHFVCSQCKNKHHTLLHEAIKLRPTTGRLNNPQTTSTDQSSTIQPNKMDPEGVVATTAGCKTVLLGTAIANIRNWKGNLEPVRIVIDSGSQFSIITVNCARRLGLTWSPKRRNVTGVGLTQIPSSKGIIRCHLSPLKNGKKILETDALVMPSITSNLPSTPLPSSLSAYFKTIDLADDKFWQSRPIEFLLGSDLFLQVLCNQPPLKVSEQFGTLPTIFGHVVLGVPSLEFEPTTSACLSVTETSNVEQDLRRFWELEEPLLTSNLSPLEANCEEHFKNNIKRLPCGRYMVGLPFREPNPEFNCFKNLAMKRFHNLELKFSKQESLKNQYHEFMKEYIELGHMEPAQSESAYMIPHHAVFKRISPANTEMKIRVVFDASMPTPVGSLNDKLLIGPKLQRDISTILLNFRAHRIAFCTDIVKMFRQIQVRPQDRQFQHILWRFSPEEALQTFELCTLTYGLSSSPYLALRVLNQLSEDEGERFPMASRLLIEDVYVDDIITGGDSLDEALDLKSQLISLLQTAGFEVHKWASNCEQLLKTITSDPRDQVGFHPIDDSTKVLGMLWDCKSDCFSYQVVQHDSVTDKITKRTMLSTIARLFDPLGLLAPVILFAKSFLQQLWLLKLSWDDTPPIEIIHKWMSFLTDLTNVNQIKVPRWIRINQGKARIFGFCDSSEKAYAAVIYLQIIETSSEVRTFLLKAKTKLAPIKTISIPRLELCAAYLLAQLIVSVSEFVERHAIETIMLFTDSTVVLSWLLKFPSQLKTYVANRVSYILTHTEPQQWNHVPSSQNPADIASRGAFASALKENSLWWKGPSWMNIEPTQLPKKPDVLLDLPELKSAVSLLSSQGQNLATSILTKFSNYSQMIRVMAFVLRFIRNVKSKINDRETGPLTIVRLDEAKNYLIRETQRQYFTEDFDFGTKSNISLRFKALACFQDKSGLLRVGGRLAYAQLPEETKHPILLPYEATFTTLLIDHVHNQYFHLGPSALQSNIQRKFYIFRIRSLIRKRIWRCLRCFKMKAKPENPFMGNLPLSRVNQGRPFLMVGVDFAGPYAIKLSQRRNAPVSKAYLCVFVCMAVKAVHLELVSALTTEAFLATFDRFVARRGLPTHIYSDNGTNFVGAARQLRELIEWYRQTDTMEALANCASGKGIQWHFNPPGSPHFGGIWEAAVKSAKIHLRKTLGDRAFNFEELSTIFSRIEAVLNSRPLCTISGNPDDFDYLTPGHFLIGSSLIAPPEKDVTDINENRQSRWQLLQNAIQIFWRRWSNEYLHLLHTRVKWTNSSSTPKIGDLVMIKNPNAMPLNWNSGRIVELHPGGDGVVRVATVKCASGLLKRAIHHLAPLPMLNNSDIKS